MDTNTILLLVALIVLLGYLAEWGFRKINVPDTLLLLLVGFILGPNVLNKVDPATLGDIAPLFTTVTLMFLMFDGSLSIDLRSLAEGIGAGITIGFTNFIVSSLAVSGIIYLVTPDIIIALMLGFALGGVSSAYIIPILKQITINKKLYSILTLESALTDVLAIVFGITMIELKVLNVLNMQNVLSQIASLFFVAGFIGALLGFLWIYLEIRMELGDRNYMMTIAYVILLYFIAEYLGGNGAIAAMSFGIVIANSRIFIEIGQKITRPRLKNREMNAKEKRKFEVVSQRERKFYQEISFFLKTFFFVYIGLLLDLSNGIAVLVGIGISVAILILRNISILFTGEYQKGDRILVNSLFARGIAPAAIVLVAMGKGVIQDKMLIDIVYFVITATVVLSSLRVFFYKYRLNKSMLSAVDKSGGKSPKEKSS